MTDLGIFLLGFGFNLLVALVLVRYIYYPSTHNKSYVFTFLAFNTVLYFMLSFLTSLEIGIGVGIGLFAVFSILRYRTDPIPIREMTYLFIIAALPLINSIGISTLLWPQMVAANLAVMAVLLMLEKEWGFHYEASKQIVYERIELIQPDRRMELVADLEQRTGLTIKRVRVGKVDFLRDVATVKIYYDDPTNGKWLDDIEPTQIVVSADAAGGYE